MKADHLDALQQALGYQFDDIELLRRALVHASAGQDDNDRLEFLGDAVLGYAVTAALSRAHDMQVPVGQLAERKASLISNRRLAAIAEALGISRQLVMGPSVGPDQDVGTKVCADALEAVIGAICEDGGMVAAEEFITRHVCSAAELVVKRPKHAKTELQEWAAARGLASPAYEVVEYRLDKTIETWRVHCVVDGLEHVGRASAPSKREAERLAAESYLEALRVA